MTKLLEEAIEQLRDLPAEDQDAAANVLFAYISSDAREYQLQPHQVAEVHRIRRGLRDGSTRLVTDGEVKAVRQKFQS
jgi:threonine aldolase